MPCPCPLIPPEKTHSYNLRTRRTNLQLPPPNTNSDKNFINRIIIGRPSFHPLNYHSLCVLNIIYLITNKLNNSLVYSYFRHIPVVLIFVELYGHASVTTYINKENIYYFIYLFIILYIYILYYIIYIYILYIYII